MSTLCIEITDYGEPSSELVARVESFCAAVRS